VLGPSEGGLGGQDAPDGFPASRRNAYPSEANAFFADVVSITYLTTAIVTNVDALVAEDIISNNAGTETEFSIGPVFKIVLLVLYLN